MAAVSGGAPLRVALLTAASVGATDGTSKWIDVSAYQNIAFVLTTNGNPGAGTCVIEEGDWNPSTNVIPSKTFSAIATVDIDATVGTDGQYVYHVAPGRFHFVRARIGTTVTVATLDVTLLAN